MYIHYACVHVCVNAETLCVCVCVRVLYVYMSVDLCTPDSGSGLSTVSLHSVLYTPTVH